MIYLDHNATSPLLPEVLEAMRPWFGVPANPSSAHRAGQRAAIAVEEARQHVARLVGGHPAGVVFTSGATEANHTFLRGARPRVIALSSIEHPSVRAASRASGATLVEMPVDATGRVRPTADEACVVSLMAANHETGVLQDLEAARALAARLGARLHVDATQAAGRVPLDLQGVDGVVLSSHKLGGPGGVGALVLPDGDPFPPLFGGGSQERGRRAGTVNTAGVVGFGEACRLAHEELSARAVRWSRQSERLRHGLRALGARLVGDERYLLPNTTCVVFPGILGESLVQALDLRGICVSSGAACASGSLEPSPVLQAMADPEPHGGLRVSLGPRSSDEDVEALLTALPEVLELAKISLLSWDDEPG